MEFYLLLSSGVSVSEYSETSLQRTPFRTFALLERTFLQVPFSAYAKYPV